MNSQDDQIKVYVNDILRVLSSRDVSLLNQTDFHEIIRSAEAAIEELDYQERERRAEEEYDQMKYENIQTKSWILRHPSHVSRAGQIEVIRSVPQFEQAIAEAGKFHSMLSERYNRSPMRNDSTKDFFTIVEMADSSTEEDARRAFLGQEEYIKLVHLSDIFR